jgi:hypothetical protein
MSARIRKIVIWALGMALAASLVAGKGSYAPTWYEALTDSPAAILGGACIGLILGFVFSRRMHVSK